MYYIMALSNLKSKPKKNMFVNERNEVIAKLNQIVGIKDVGHFDLDNIDEIKQKKITNLDTDVKKYFVCSSWTYFKDYDMDKPFLSLLKNIYKSMGYKVIQMATTKKENGILKRYIRISIEK
jgi:hypothetical protein